MANNNSYDTLVITFKKVLKKLVINEKKEMAKIQQQEKLVNFCRKARSCTGLFRITRHTSISALHRLKYKRHVKNK
jgi:hypothetical protein